MTTERPETPTPLSSPQDILSAKDTILKHWQQLPTEHQATMALVLVHQALADEWGEWLSQALAVSAPLFPVDFNRVDLDSILTAEEIAKLTNQDLQDMARKVEDHFKIDWFWKELEAAARRRLDQK